MNYTKSQIFDNIRNMDPYDFEDLVAEVYRMYGWNVSVTSSSQDRGVDVIATQHYPIKLKVLIQVKRYNEGNSVGSPEITQYAALKEQEDGDLVAVVTSSQFTKQAVKIAEQLNVKLVDGDKLCSSIADLKEVEHFENLFGSKSESNSKAKFTTKKERIEQIKSKFPHRTAGKIKEVFLSSRSSDEPYQNQYGLHSPAIKRTNETETVELYWQDNQGVGLLQQKNRLNPLHSSQLNIITDENLIVIIARDRSDKVLKISLSDIQEVIPPDRDSDPYSGLKNDIEIKLRNKKEIDWFEHEFKTIYLGVGEHQYKREQRIIDRLRGSVFICNECGSNVTEYHRAEGTDICEKCFARSSL